METLTLLPATQPWDQPQAFSRLHVDITVDVMSIFSREQISPSHPPRCDPPDSRPCRIKSCPLITAVVNINPSLLRTSHGPCWKLPEKTLPVGPTFCFFFSTDKPGSSQTAFGSAHEFKETYQHLWWTGERAGLKGVLMSGYRGRLLLI